MIYEEWFAEFESLVINYQLSDADLDPEEFRGMYEAGMTPYEAMEVEYPNDYK